MSMVYDIVKYKSQRVGTSTVLWAIVKHPVHTTVAVAIGEIDRQGKKTVKALSEFVGEIGLYTNCTEAKRNIIVAFESKQKDLLEKMLKDTKQKEEKLLNSIDNTNKKEYNKEVDSKQNKNEKGNETMKTSRVSKAGKVSTAGKVQIVSKVDAFSKTRDTEEQIKVTIQPTFAEVVSGSGNKYIVTRESCTCQDHFFRGHDRVDAKTGEIKTGTVCRHRTAVADVVQALNNSAKYW